MKLKKVLASILCLAMVLSTMSFTAFAAGDSNETEAVAMFNGEYYSTVEKALADAVASTDEEVTIKVLQDVARLPEPQRAGLTFEAAEGVKVTSYVECPWRTPVQGVVKYVGFDFTTYDTANGLYATRNGQENLEGFEAVFENCAFGGEKSIGIWHWAVKGRMEKITLDNCTIVDGAQAYFQFGAVNNVVFQNCDFSNYTGEDYIIHLPDSAGNITATNCQFGNGFIHFAPNIGEFERSIKVDECTFEGDKAVVVHENVTNAKTPIDSIELINNTVEETTELINFVDETVNVEEYLENNASSVIATGNATVSGEAVTEISTGYTPAAPVALVKGKYHTTIQAALDAAEENDTITLVSDAEMSSYIQLNKNITIDLDGNTLYMTAEPNTTGFHPELRKCSYYITADVTFANGEMVVSNEEYASHGNFFVEVGKSLTFDGVELTTDGINAFALIQTYGDLKFVNQTDVSVSNESSSFVYSEENLGDVNVDNSAITLENVGAGIAGSGVGFTATDSEITMTNISGNGLANVNGTVTDTNISITGAEYGIKNTIGTLEVKGESEVSVTGSTEADIKLGSNGNITVDDTADVNTETMNAIEVDGKYYGTIEKAVAAAVNNSTIDLLGNVVEFNGSYNGIEGSKNLTFINGTMDFTGARADDSVFFLWGEDLTFENIKFVRNESDTFMCYLMNVSSADSVVIFTDCEFEFNDAIFSSYIANNAGGQITFTGCKISGTTESNFVYNGGVLFDNCIYNSEEADIIAHNNFPSEIRNSQVVTKRIRVRNNPLTPGGAEPTVRITGNSHVYAVEGVLYTTEPAEGETRNALIFVEEGATLLAEESADGIISDTTGGSVVSKANTVKLTFEETAKQEVYEIYVEAIGGDLNRMSAVQVKFALETLNGENMKYILAPASEFGVTLTNDIDDEKAYVFNFNGVTTPDATGSKLLIGTVTFGGYGEFNFKVDSTYAGNKVKAAQFTDNIVEEYVPTPDPANAKQGTFDITSSAITGAEVVEAKREVKVVINFKNELSDVINDADYNDMTVTLTGSNNEVHTAQVGDLVDVLDDEGNVTGQISNYTAEKAEMTFNVTAGYRYTVVVEGEGYRTARYSTNVDAADDALVLTFWNNALENPDRTERFDYIEKDVKRSLKSVTFLAGDIAQDNIIDKYDLAAVVSYFGFDELQTTNRDYVKYDLNRDGKIDADDISYVLISWGK